MQATILRKIKASNPSDLLAIWVELDKSSDKAFDEGRYADGDALDQLADEALTQLCYKLGISYPIGEYEGHVLEQLIDAVNLHKARESAQRMGSNPADRASALRLLATYCYTRGIEHDIRF